MLNEKNFSPFYSSFLALCSQKGVAPSVAARNSGISSGAPTAWKNGAVPKPAQREKLCAYFGVSDETLLGYKNAEKTPTLEGERSADLSPAFFRLKQGLEPYDLSEADAEFLLEVYKAHIKKNQ